MVSESKIWKIKELIAAGVLDIGDGYRAKNNELSDSGLPFARAGNINGGFDFADADRFPTTNLGRVGNKVSRIADVVFTSKGTVGRFAFVEAHTERFVYSPQLCYWRSLSPEAIGPRFLYYWMHSPECLDQFSYLKSQTDMADYVSLRDQREMTISLPEPSLQTSVVSMLAPLDSRIDILQRSNESLEAMARTIFKSWFVDFDPVRAKAEGREPEGMDADTAALFPSSLAISRLGQIPEDWQIDSLGSVIKIAYGKNLPTAKLVESGYPVFGGNGPIGFNDKFMYETRQVLVACRGAASGRVNQSTTRSFVTNNSLVLESDSNTLLPFGYLKGYMKNADLSPFVTGSAQPQVTIENLRRFEILIPSRSALRAYESISSTLEDRIAENDQQVTTLRDLRDTLLPRLISGKLRVPEAEKLVEAMV